MNKLSNYFKRKLGSKLLSYLFKGLQQVAARHRQGDVYVVHYEERLFLALVWETGKVVCYKQQHVYLRFLQKGQKKGNIKLVLLQSFLNDTKQN